MRAGLLARVSTEGQAEAGRHSLGMQRSMMEAYAAREGMEVVAVFEIPGESAYRGELASRPQFEAAILAAERGEFDVLLVYDLSRFARHQKVLHECLYRLERAGVRLIGVHNGLDYTSGDGRDWAGIEGVFAERASREAGRRIGHAKRQAFEDGLAPWKLPFGYRRGPDGSAEIVPEEAVAVCEVFRLRNEGSTDGEIAAYLNSTGLRPRSRSGYTGWVSTNCRLYRTAFYAGFVTLKGEQRPGRHEAIVSEAIFEQAQARPGQKRPRANVTVKGLLQGMAFCAWCGQKLWLTMRGIGGWDLAYFDPAVGIYKRECESKVRTWRLSEADGLVEATMRSLAAEKDWLSLAVRVARKGSPVVAGVGDRRRALIAERERATEAYVAGALPRERWQAITARVEGELMELPQNVDRVLQAVRELESFGDAWEMASLERRREAVGMVFARVLVDLGEHEVQLEAREGYEGLLSAKRAAVCGERAWAKADGVSPRLFAPAELGVAV